MIARSRQLSVLTAAVRLGEFTSEDLAHTAGVGVNTVRTVMRRHPDIFDRIGAKRDGRRGGAYQLYRVRPDRSRALWREINALVPRARHEPRAEAAASADEALGDVLEAVELLGRRFEEDADRAHVVELARLAVGDLQQRFTEDAGQMNAVCRLLDGVLAVRGVQLASPDALSAVPQAIGGVLELAMALTAPGSRHLSSHQATRRNEQAATETEEALQRQLASIERLEALANRLEELASRGHKGPAWPNWQGDSHLAAAAPNQSKCLRARPEWSSWVRDPQKAAAAQLDELEVNLLSTLSV